MKTTVKSHATTDKKTMTLKILVPCNNYDTIIVLLSLASRPVS